MILKIDSVFKLDEDLQDMLITNDIIPDPRFNKIDCVPRHLYQAYRKNLYLIEPKCYYYIVFDEQTGIFDEKTTNLFNINDLKKYGLFSIFNHNDYILYLFNPTENQVFIQQDTKFTI